MAYTGSKKQLQRDRAARAAKLTQQPPPRPLTSDLIDHSEMDAVIERQGWVVVCQDVQRPLPGMPPYVAYTVGRSKDGSPELAMFGWRREEMVDGLALAVGAAEQRATPLASGQLLRVGPRRAFAAEAMPERAMVELPQAYGRYTFSSMLLLVPPLARRANGGLEPTMLAYPPVARPPRPAAR
jgi:hypothetical protein